MGMKSVLFIGLGCPAATQIEHVCTHGEVRGHVGDVTWTFLGSRRENISQEILKLKPGGSEAS